MGTIKAEELDGAIQEYITRYSENVKNEIDKSLKEVAKQTEEMLEKGGSYKERKGDYTPGWAISSQTGTNELGEKTRTYIVSNKRRAQLTHLLEKGHVSRNGSRVKPYVHIAPAEQMAQENAVIAVTRAIENANNRG